MSTRKGGGFYGYKIHAAVCTRTGLPLVWRVETAREHESQFALPLLDALVAQGFTPETGDTRQGLRHRTDPRGLRGCRVPSDHPTKKTSAVLQRDKPPTCEHGTWTFAWADFKNGRAKWRCPTGECHPASIWRKASRLHPLIPRDSKRFGTLYAGRSAVEREFGRLKHEYGLAPLRTRTLPHVSLHADLAILARFSLALTRARSAPVPLPLAA